MAKKEFTYRGKSVEELKTLEMKELVELLPSRQRRKIKRGFTEAEKIVIKKVKAGDSNLKTHCRDMIILPIMIGTVIKVYTGKAFEEIRILPEMVGNRLGEYAVTRKGVSHSAPGVGATRSSAAMSVR